MGEQTSVSERRKTALSRAIWNEIDRKTKQGTCMHLDTEAADHIVERMCDVVHLIIEDMRSVSEFRRIGFEKRHWYALELQISDSEISAQNVLEGAGACRPSLQPAHFGILLNGLKAFAAITD